MHEYIINLLLVFIGVLEIRKIENYRVSFISVPHAKSNKMND